MKRVLNRGRYLRGLAFGTFGFCVSSAVCSTGKNKEWVELTEHDLQLPNLAEPFAGLRMVHVSDFHCSRTVSSKYIKKCIQRINSLDPDIIVLTGDYITHDYYGRFSKKISRMITKLKSTHGVYACLGNHDYGVGGAFHTDKSDSLGAMVDRFQQGGIRVLRNDSHSLELDGHKLWFVGLGDPWARDFHPHIAFDDVNDEGASVIALSHNPDTIHHLEDYNFDAILSGHTHGCGFEWTTLPDKPLVNRRKFCSGMYHHQDRKLYVNRGLGRHGRIFNRRPEITVFTLR